MQTRVSKKRYLTMYCGKLRGVGNENIHIKAGLAGQFPFCGIGGSFSLNNVASP